MVCSDCRQIRKIEFACSFYSMELDFRNPFHFSCRPLLFIEFAKSLTSSPGTRFPLRGLPRTRSSRRSLAHHSNQLCFILDGTSIVSKSMIEASCIFSLILESRYVVRPFRTRFGTIVYIQKRGKSCENVYNHRSFKRFRCCNRKRVFADK